MMKLQVLISTMNLKNEQENKELIKKMNKKNNFSYIFIKKIIKKIIKINSIYFIYLILKFIFKTLVLYLTKDTLYAYVVVVYLN